MNIRKTLTDGEYVMVVNGHAVAHFNVEKLSVLHRGIKVNHGRLQDVLTEVMNIGVMEGKPLEPFGVVNPEPSPLRRSFENAGWAA